MKKYLKEIKQDICSICADSDDRGKCSLTEEEICAIEYFLPKIVEVVHSIKSDDIFEYHQKLREEVCKNCKASSDGIECYLRDDANCALDRYFPLIVETIQKVDNQAI
ncbi:hypothetical protein ACFLS9_08290 [Bacteroidota bacterium]